jgi:hypothetical protein
MSFEKASLKAMKKTSSLSAKSSTAARVWLFSSNAQSPASRIILFVAPKWLAFFTKSCDASCQAFVDFMCDLPFLSLRHHSTAQACPLM